VRFSVALTTLAGAATLAAPALADGGYYGGAQGARASGRSGAFVARADDPTAIVYNPAGLAGINGTLFMVGNRFSYNGYAYKRADTLNWGDPTATQDTAPPVSFPEVTNGSPWQPLDPMIAVASNLGLPNWGFGAGALAAPGASKLDFPADGGQRYMMRSREAIFLDYALSAAWKHHDTFGVGATLVWIVVPRLNYSLVIDGTPFVMTANNVSSPLDMTAETKGADWFTPNAIVGAWYRPAPFLQFGFAGQVIPASVETNSKLTVTPFDTTMGQVVLRRDGRAANDVYVILPLPLMARLGARYRHLSVAREIFDVELDVEYETWSRVNEFALETHDLVGTFQGADVNLGRIGIAKRWQDTVAVKLGGDVAVTDSLALRAGAYYESAVAPSAYSNVDFPGGPMVGGSLGGSFATGHWEVAIAYQLRQMLEVNVAEADARVFQQVPASACTAPYMDPNLCHRQFLGQPSPQINGGSYRSTSHYLSLALLYRYGS
jgi:long-chain fatty acid transport protein